MKYDIAKQTIFASAYIYKIQRADEHDDNFYIGSTKDIFSRLIEHKQKYKEGKRKIYKYIKEHGEFDNWEIIIIDKFDYKSKEDVILREAYWQYKLKPSLNANCAGGNEKTTKAYKKRKYGDKQYTDETIK